MLALALAAGAAVGAGDNLTQANQLEGHFQPRSDTDLVSTGTAKLDKVTSLFEAIARLERQMKASDEDPTSDERLVDIDASQLE